MGIKLSLLGKTPLPKPSAAPQKASTPTPAPVAPKPVVTPPAPVKPAPDPTPKTGGLTIKRKVVMPAPAPTPAPVPEKIVTYPDLKDIPRANVGKTATPKPNVHVIPLEAKVKMVAKWMSEKQSWITGDTGTVVASYEHGRPEFRPGLDLYKIVLDAPRIPGKDTIVVNYKDIEAI